MNKNITLIVTNPTSATAIPADCARPNVTGLASTTGQEVNRNIVSFPNSFFCGYDLEKSAGILFQGVNTRASPPFLNLFIGTTLDASVNVNAWGMSDVILQVDTIAKQITAFI